MSEAIVVALITGGLALVGAVVTTVITSNTTLKKTETKIQISQAVTDEKITELTREVREHNNFAKRVPVIEEQIKVINHRISDLENIMKKP